MAAIITDDFRRNQAKLLVNDIKASSDAAYDSGNLTSTMQDRYRYNSVYGIGLGKTDAWPNDSAGRVEDNLDFTVTPPSGTQQEVEDVINNLFTVKEVSTAAANQLIAKNTWTSGRKYKVYDGADNDCFYVTGDVYPSYVTHAGNVYLCVSNSAQENATLDPQPSSNPPSHASYAAVTNASDGYVWAHIQALPTAGDAEKFTTPQFAPILEETGPGNISNSDTFQGGLFSHIGIIDGGTGYTSAATVTVTGVKEDGTNQTMSAYKFKPIVSSTGAIERIVMQESSAAASDTGSLTYWGAQLKGLKSVTVNINRNATQGNSRNATAFGLVAPSRGFSANAIDFLPTWFVGCIANFINTEGGDAYPLKFRQISLLKNFSRNEDSDGTTSTYDALKYIEATTVTEGSLIPGDVLESGNGARFYFNAVDTSVTPNRLYYHQNSNSEVNLLDPGTGPLNGAVTVAVSTTATTGATVITQADAIQDGEYAHRDANGEFNGEVVFHENRVPFQRTSTQTEEVKLIIQL